MSKLQMSIGENLPEVLLNICQEKMRKGDPNALSVYTESLMGFTDEYALMILKNEAVLCVKDNEVIMSDDKKLIDKNRSNIYDWKSIITKKQDEIENILNSIHKIDNDISNRYTKDINNIDLSEMAKKLDDFMIGSSAIVNISTHPIGNTEFAPLLSNGEKSWERLVEEVENAYNDNTVNDVMSHKVILYNIWKYVSNIRSLYKSLKKFDTLYNFLVDKGICDRIPKIEPMYNHAFVILTKFMKEGNYSHPMLNESIKSLKDNILDELKSINLYEDYVKYHLVPVNIEDGYDAGLITPEGLFFGADGHVSDLIHLTISERLFNGDDNAAEKMSYMKIHNDEAYIYLRYYKDDSDDTRLYVPTNEQLRLLEKYINKFYNGIVYTSPKIVDPNSDIKISKIMQADEIQLHEIFLR